MIKNSEHSKYQKMLNDRKEVVSYQYSLIKQFRRDINEFQEYIFHATEETDKYYIEEKTTLIKRFNLAIRAVKGYIAENEKLIKSLKKQIKLVNR